MHKSTHPFSAIAIDHAHEQNNAVVKGDGGAIGLTQNPRALLRLMVAGPEIARTIDGFETACLDNHIGRDNGRHHEHTMAVQVTFASDVQALVEVIEDLGNPFKEESGDLLVLDTRDIADPAVVTTVRGIEKKGHDQYDSFVTDRLVERTSPVSDTISKNSMPLFNRPSKRTPSKATQMITSLKSDCALFSRTWTISSSMKIMHTHHPCRSWENCGSVQRQISQIAWRSCAHPKAKLQSSTSSYWLELLSSTC